MDFVITHRELDALSGLPHTQRLVYLLGIRPYMDLKTGIVGIKRGISFQSIAEQLYIEPHQGIKSVSFSRAQIRRALAGLEKVGLIISESEEYKLILKCPLASRDYFIQKKAVTKPSHKAVTLPTLANSENKGFLPSEIENADIPKPSKADTPLIKDNYIYLLSQFEKFWFLYPEKKSHQSTWEIFQHLNPDPALFNKIIKALQEQIKVHEEKQAKGIWVPPWKYPTNWLIQRCWDDEITIDINQENQNASNRDDSRNEANKDMFWNPSESENEQTNNVIPFTQLQ